MKNDYGFFIKYRNLLFLVFNLLLLALLIFYFVKTIIFSGQIVQRLIFSTAEMAQMESFNVDALKEINLEKFKGIE